MNGDAWPEDIPLLSPDTVAFGYVSPTNLTFPLLAPSYVSPDEGGFFPQMGSEGFKPEPEPAEPVTKRQHGNNPYGSRGTYSCEACRRRKGKCKYISKVDKCEFCKRLDHPCGRKLSKSEFLAIQNGKPCPPLKYSSIAIELEREFPNMIPEEIHILSGERLKTMRELHQLDDVLPGFSPTPSMSPISPIPVSSPRRKRVKRE